MSIVSYPIYIFYIYMEHMNKKIGWIRLRVLRMWVGWGGGWGEGGVAKQKIY
jgi:hypothetical protein